MARSVRSDEGIIAALKGGRDAHNEALWYVYEKLDWKGMVVRYLEGKGAMKLDALELANDTLIIFSRKLRFNGFKGNSTLKTFFVGIAYKLWLNHFKKLKKKRDIIELNAIQMEVKDVSIEDVILSDERIGYIQELTRILGEKCEAVFSMLALELSRDEMASDLELANTGMVKKAVWRCRKKLKQLIEDNPQWKSLIY